LTIKFATFCKASAIIEVTAADGCSTMEDDNLENSLTEMDWLLQLSGLTSGEPEESPESPEHGVVDFSLVRISDASYPAVVNYRSKPPFSYTHLITEAINSTQHKRMSLSEIYAWIRENYPYYRTAAPGWKVSTSLFMKTINAVTIC